jgi:hypothetical protein
MRRRKVDRSQRVPLSRRPFGIESFRVQGHVSAEPVEARWDGQLVCASRTLWEHAMVSIAVDEAFIEAGIEAGIDASPPSWTKGSPEELMLAMINCCDRIDVAEYALEGHRRVISA